MKTWMLPWLFPLGLLGSVVFVVVLNQYAALVALPVAWVLVPVLWHVRFRPTAAEGSDSDTHYWRITRP